VNGVGSPAVTVSELIAQSDEVWQRMWARFAGLSDEEYFWEPAPGCWTIRRRPDGVWISDGALPRPDPEPFTTIAWRLWHLIDMYGEDRAPQWLGVAPQGEPIGLDDPDGSPPGGAAEALSLLERAHGRWDAHLALVSDDQLAQPVGPIGGEYGDRTRAKYVLHMLDEFIHHSAEVALLRDLWRWQAPADPDPLAERVIRGDVDAIADVLDGRSIGRRSPSELLQLAASYSRWEIVLGLVRGGVSPLTGGRTPLHSAAIVGALEVVQALVEHGADINARDPQFDATPLTWARFTGREHVAAWLVAHGATE
jgi:uncharacterized damage-inducible protein DinB